MWYVYIIRSIYFPDQEYIGATADLKRRLPEHNAGRSTHITPPSSNPGNWSGTAPALTNTKRWNSKNTSNRTPAEHSRRSALNVPSPPLLLQHRIEPVAQRDEVVLHRR
jgi:hypothetical protein